MNPNLNPPLRKVLADSKIADVTIALLLFGAMESGLRAIWFPVFRLLFFLFNAIAIMDIPTHSFNELDRYQAITAISYLLTSLFVLFGVFALSYWMYGTGPIRRLRNVRDRMQRGRHA